MAKKAQSHTAYVKLLNTEFFLGWYKSSNAKAVRRFAVEDLANILELRIVPEGQEIAPTPPVLVQLTLEKKHDNTGS